MAAEGLDPEELAANWQQQVDEALALEGIFGEDCFRLEAGEGLPGLSVEGGGQALPLEAVEGLAAVAPPAGGWQLRCSLAVDVQPPLGRLLLRLPGEGVQGAGPSAAAPRGSLDASSSSPATSAASGSTAGSSAPGEASVQHLPPIHLRLCLHPAYPSRSPPCLLSLSAPWLAPSQAAALAEQLHGIWEEQGPGLPIIYQWAAWLQASALLHIGFTEALVLPHKGTAGSKAGPCSPADCVAGEPQEGGSPQGAIELLHQLLRFDAKQEQLAFQGALHTCGVCFEEQPGSRFVRLDCRHAFCQGCLQTHCSLHVTEGALDQLRCPEPKCGEPLSPQVLRQLLAPQDYLHWETLMLQRTLDRMRDATFCPRCSAVCLEDGDGCAQCAACLFVFCTRCRDGWHPGSACLDAMARLAVAEVKAKAVKAGDSKAGLEPVRRMVMERLSLAAVEATCKRCPTCQAAIQKVDGCNHVWCPCGTHLCYACGAELDAQDPYAHFRDGNMDCGAAEGPQLERWERAWARQMQTVAKELAADDLQGQQVFLGLLQEHDPQAYRQLPLKDPRHLVAGARRCVCPRKRCRQENWKIGSDNNMVCYACGHHFCYLCKAVLEGRGGAHFNLAGGCKQHTPG